MKKLLGIAALMLAFTPFAHAQDGAGLAGHPEARNDRQAVHEHVTVLHPHHAMRHHHVKHHHLHHVR